MSNVIIRTNYGQIKGIDHGDYVEFRKVPYAKPPVGELRFREPQPAEPWSGILDANQNTKACYQVNDFLNISSIQTEDCLFLNV